MSHDLRRISLLAIVLLVLLRVSIGWQFLYEGLWKYQSQKTADPWTAKGYLINAQGPFRSFFRGMVDDPDELNWLDYEHVKSDWERWQKKFASHYDLTEEQEQSLNELVHGRETFEVPLQRMPQGKEDFSKGYGPTIPRIFGFRPGKEPGQPGTLFVKKGEELLPEYIRRLRELVPTKGEEDFHAAVNALWKKYTASSRDFVQELEDILVNDPAVTGEPIKDDEGNVIEVPPGEIKAYKAMLAEYEEELANADRSSTYEHLKTKSAEIQEKKSELIGPVKALDAELKADAYTLLTAEQRQMSPLPAEPTQLSSLDQRTMWMLMILGGLLIAGCFTRVSAFLGAGMVLMFYLAMPPFPGLPPLPGPEHSFIINKNFIEIVALLALAALPSGSWFGVDAIFRRIFLREKPGTATASSKPAPKKDKKEPVAAGT